MYLLRFVSTYFERYFERYKGTLKRYFERYVVFYCLQRRWGRWVCEAFEARVRDITRGAATVTRRASVSRGKVRNILDGFNETGNLLERGAHAYVARHFNGGILKGGDRLGVVVVLFVHEALGERGDEHDE